MTGDVAQMRSWLAVATGREVAGNGVAERISRAHEARRRLSDALPGLLDELEQLRGNADRLPLADARLDAARRALVATGYFTADQVGDDIAPRITEYAASHGEPDDDDEVERLIPRPEAMTEWFTAYGVRLMSVGEDGDWVALGHVEPPRMIAAMRKAARDQLRLDDEEVFGSRSGGWDGPLAVVEHLRAYFTEHDECGWWAHWGDEAQGHRAAVDVTVWRA